MNKHNIKVGQELDRPAGALAEDILNASDQDILAEVKEDGEDPAVIAAEMRAVFDRALAKTAKGGK